MISSGPAPVPSTYPVPSPDATGALTLYAAVLVAVPAHLVVQPIGASGTPAGLFGVAALAWWAAAWLVPSSGLERGLQPIRLATGLFCASIMASYAGANIKPLPPDMLSAADRGIISMASWAGISLVACDMIRRLESLEKLLRWLVLLAAGLAGLGILQFFFGIDIAAAVKIPGLSPNSELAFISERSDFRRVAGTASHPIEFGMVLAVVFPLAVHFAFYAPGRRYRLALAVLALAIPMSLSRSAFLGLAVGSLMLLAVWPWRLRARALLLAAGFSVGVRLMVPGLLGTIKSLFANLGSDPSIQGRTEDFQAVGDFILRNLWLGQGFGTFLPERFFFLDNQYIGSLIETGLFGFATLLLLFVIGIFTARGARRLAPTEEYRHLGQALAASIACAMVGFVTFDGLGFPMIDGIVFLVLGCTGALWRLLGGNRPRPGLPAVAADASERSSTTSPS